MHFWNGTRTRLRSCAGCSRRRSGAESEQRLVLVRDRMGIKPLYVAEQSGELYFGSEVKTILLHPEIDRSHRAAPVCIIIFRMNYVPRPATLVAGIEKLSAGTLDGMARGGSQSQAYWKLEFAPDRSITLGRAKEELDWLLRDSVREHLVADVPAGSLVQRRSGFLHHGALRGRTRARPVEDFLRFLPRPQVRRKPATSDRWRERYGTDHHEFDLNPDVRPSGRDRGVRPLFRRAQRGRGRAAGLVPLEDDAGGKSPWRFPAKARTNFSAAIPPTWRTAMPGACGCCRCGCAGGPDARPGCSRCRTKKSGWITRSRACCRARSWRPVEAHHFWNGTFSTAGRRSAAGPARPAKMPAGEPLDCRRAGLRSGNGVGYLNRFLWLDQMYYLPDDILYKSDRMSMAHSLEVRPPFLDHRIVEFAARLPENLKIRGGAAEIVLRELMKDIAPGRCCAARKRASTFRRISGCARCCVRCCWIRSMSAASGRIGNFFLAGDRGHLPRPHGAAC